MLTLFAGLLGCLLGLGINELISKLHIVFHNVYIVQLFGGTELHTVVTWINLTRCMGVSVLLAFVGWFYPAHIALTVSPVQAMQGLR
jgi:ABC-type lipoprotein release transport system permease subunit